MSSVSAAGATLLLVGDEAEKVARGLEVERRMERLGLSMSALAARASMDRATLKRIITGRDGVRTRSLVAVERALDDFEEETSKAVSDEPEAGVIRVELSGVHAGEAVVVEGPVDNLDQLEEMVDRIMRRLRQDDDNG